MYGRKDFSHSGDVRGDEFSSQASNPSLSSPIAGTVQGETMEDDIPDDRQGHIDSNNTNEFIEAEVDDHGAPMDEDDSDGGEDDQQFTDTSIAAFYDHRDSIFSIKLHPSFPEVPLAFTGGADDRGRLWDTRTGGSLVELGGHTDSVVAGGFSSAGDYVATGGLDGLVRVWKLHPPPSGHFAPVDSGHGGAAPHEWGQCEFITSLEGPDEVVWIRWHPKGSVLAAGASDSTVWMWKLPEGKVMHVFSGHTGAVTCGDFTADGRRLVTASDDGSLIVWDPKDATALSKLQPTDARFNLATGITSLALSADSKLAVVGGAAGAIRVVNLSNIDEGGAALVVSQLEGHTDGESIECISFVDLLGSPSGKATLPTPRVTTSANVITAGTDGKAIVWDLSNAKIRCEAVQDEPITDLTIHGSGPLFSTSSADGKIVTWDARSATCIAVHTGFTDAVLNVVVGADDGYTQGSETGGVGAYVNLDNSRGWKVIGTGDEGVALVFRV